MVRTRLAIPVALAAMVLVASTSSAAPTASSGTDATRATAVQRYLVDRHGRPLDGRGVSIAVIDTGVDATHPAFALPGGGTKVVRNLTALPCIGTQAVSQGTGCVMDVPLTGTSDVGHGGHGTFVGSVAVGDHYVLGDGSKVGGQAPGARLVMISTTAALQGLYQAFAWVLENHEHPCGTSVSAAICPPIKVLSLSWGANDPVITGLQRQLVAQGVVVVWAIGNGGGDGSTNVANAVASTDPTPGVLGVAGYDDLGTGTQNGHMDPGSSRGAAKQPSTWPDISAPSVNVVGACRAYQAVCVAVGTDPRNGPGSTDLATYFTGTGTSWAAPAVAGVIALLLQARPDATPAQLDDALKRTAHKYRSGAPYRRVGRYTSSFDKGTGLIDAYSAALAFGARQR
jgi:serine protease AprX